MSNHHCPFISYYTLFEILKFMNTKMLLENCQFCCRTWYHLIDNNKWRLPTNLFYTLSILECKGSYWKKVLSERCTILHEYFYIQGQECKKKFYTRDSIAMFIEKQEQDYDNKEDYTPLLVVLPDLEEENIVRNDFINKKLLLQYCVIILYHLLSCNAFELIIFHELEHFMAICHWLRKAIDLIAVNESAEYVFTKMLTIVKNKGVFHARVINLDFSSIWKNVSCSKSDSLRLLSDYQLFSIQYIGHCCYPICEGDKTSREIFSQANDGTVVSVDCRSKILCETKPGFGFGTTMILNKFDNKIMAPCLEDWRRFVLDILLTNNCRLLEVELSNDFAEDIIRIVLERTFQQEPQKQIVSTVTIKDNTKWPTFLLGLSKRKNKMAVERHFGESDNKYSSQLSVRLLGCNPLSAFYEYADYFIITKSNTTMPSEPIKQWLFVRIIYVEECFEREITTLTFSKFMLSKLHFS